MVVSPLTYSVMSYLAVYCRGKEPYQRKLDGDVVIGRGLGCELWLDDGRLSRRHCRVHREQDYWVVEDLGSTNGTSVQGEMVHRHILRDGDSFEVGDTRVVFHADERHMHTLRPSDPASASRIQRALSETGADKAAIDPSVAASLPHVPSPVRSEAHRPHHRAKRPNVPLPFARPPARPIIDEASRRSNFWSLGGLLSRFRRKGEKKPI
jgi:pSer/pThr/pTyr-binding forkhead associated (FHA) protein